MSQRRERHIYGKIQQKRQFSFHILLGVCTFKVKGNLQRWLKFSSQAVGRAQLGRDTLAETYFCYTKPTRGGGGGKGPGMSLGQCLHIIAWSENKSAGFHFNF